MNAEEKFKPIADFILEKSQLHSLDFEFRIDHYDFKDSMTFEEFGAIIPNSKLYWKFSSCFYNALGFTN